MKKLFMIILTLALAMFCFTACVDKNNNKNDGDFGGKENGEILQKSVISFYVDDELYHTVSTFGKEKISMPIDPVKTDYNFNGWYTDKGIWESIFTASSYESKSLTSDLSVYAYFTIKPSEYCVTFNLNYEDYDDPIEKMTENGMISFVPQREGYVFNGWWFSGGKTSEGYVLTQKFDTNQRITSDIILYAEWIEEQKYANQLTTPTVLINGDSFQWNEIEGAQKYNIRVYRSGMEVDSYTTSSLYWNFPSYFDAAYYTVKIRAIGDGVNKVNSNYISKSYAHKILTPVTDMEIDINTSILNFIPAPTASEYEIYLNGSTTAVATINSPSYDMSDYDAGEYTVKVVARRSGYESASATAMLVKRRLTTPVLTDISNDDDSLILFWNAVVKADTYIISMDGVEIARVRNSQSVKINDINYEKGGEINIQAFDSNADYLLSNENIACIIDNELVWNMTGEKATLCLYCGTGTELVLPDTYEGKEYTIKLGAIPSTSNLQKITLPFVGANDGANKNFGYIFGANNYQNNATYVPSSLTEVVLSDGVAELSSYAFSQCESLTSVTIPNSVTSIGDYAFSWCRSLTSITIPDSVTSIGEDAFYWCESLTSITIPNSVTSIGAGAFMDTAYYNTAVNWENEVLYVGKHLIESKRSVSGEYVIKDGTVCIAEAAFRNCESLTSVTIPNSVTSIGSSAFYICDSLTSVTIGNSVTSIGSSAFYGCPIEKATIPTKAISYIKNSSLKEVIITSGESIGYQAFRNCKSLTSVTIGNSVTSIGDSAFRYCSNLTSVTIPNSVTSIGNYAFEDCNKLKTINYTGTRQEWLAITKGSSWYPSGNYTINYNYSEE